MHGAAAGQQRAAEPDAPEVGRPVQVPRFTGNTCRIASKFVKRIYPIASFDEFCPCLTEHNDLQTNMIGEFPHGYALLIGVGTTAYSPWSLPITVKDVQAVRKVLTDPAFCGYPDNESHIRLMHDHMATRTAILDGLKWLKSRTAADPEATAIVFYSGHGWLDQTSGRYYLIPHDVEPFDVAVSALPAEDFAVAVQDVKSRRILVVIDSCHAQGMATSKDSATPMKLPPNMEQASATEGKGLTEALKCGEGRVVLASSRGRQLSWLRSDGLLSVFTHHLLEALQGAGNKPGEAEVRWSNLMGHLGRAVPISAVKMHSAEQVPFFDTAAEDFPVALLRGGKGLPTGGWNAVMQATEEFSRQVTNVIASGERAVAIGGAAPWEHDYNGRPA